MSQSDDFADNLRKFGFITQNKQLLERLECIDQVAASDISLVITGASGTGKNVIADYIHAHSKRKSKPMVTVDVTCLSPGVVESELFGHERGSFTSAISTHIGACERADGSVLFLDEIGDLSLDLQKKLLRAIETRTIRRVGGNHDIPLDFRIITATNKNIRKMTAKRKFRKDLFFRLHEASIHLPPLCRRIDDIPLLCEYFVEMFNKELDKNIRGVSSAALSYLSKYNWPGNIRELRNVIKSAMAMASRDKLWIEDIPLHFPKSQQSPQSYDSLVSLEEMEKGYIEYVLEQCKWNKSKAARILAISRPRLHRLISRFSLLCE